MKLSIYNFTLSIIKNIIKLNRKFTVYVEAFMRIAGITYVHQKKHRVRNFFTFLFVLLFLVMISMVIISVYIGWGIVHPAREAVHTLPPNTLAGYKDVNFVDKTKTVILNGWFFSANGSNKTIILAHGYGKNRLQFGEQTTNLIKSLLDKNYNVLAFDFRNSGESGGKLTSMGLYEKDDLLGAVEYVKSQGAKHIILMGFSTGASASILAAAETNSVDALIVDSPFSDLKEYLDNGLSKWSNLPAVPFNETITFSIEILANIDPAKASPRSVIDKIAPRPILFIYGKDSKTISAENSNELYRIYSKSAGDKAVLWETEDIDHVGSYIKFPQQYTSTVLGFLGKVCP